MGAAEKGLRRYDLELVGSGYNYHEEMVPCDDGKWVLFDDVAELAAANVALRRQIKAEPEHAANGEQNLRP